MQCDLYRHPNNKSVFLSRACHNISDCETIYTRAQEAIVFKSAGLLLPLLDSVACAPSSSLLTPRPSRPLPSSLIARGFTSVSSDGAMLSKEDGANDECDGVVEPDAEGAVCTFPFPTSTSSSDGSCSVSCIDWVTCVDSTGTCGAATTVRANGGNASEISAIDSTGCASVVVLVISATGFMFDKIAFEAVLLLIAVGAFNVDNNSVNELAFDSLLATINGLKVGT